MIYIYGLYTDEDIRYVGKTNNLEKRLNEHIRDAKCNKNTHKHNWIRKELKNNKEIKIKILEECNIKNWEEKEKLWIKKYNNLTNCTEGGEGGHGDLYFISYTDAKNIIHQLNINSKTKWYEYIKNNKIENIPSDPNKFFKNNGWISWGDFLGTNRVQDNKIIKVYLTYEEAKRWVSDNLNNITTQKKWKEITKENKIPIFIPNRPERYFSKNKSWISWGDFLGTKRIANQNKIFISYNDAKKIIQKLNIKSQRHWIKIYHKEIKKYNIPSSPNYTYKDWVSWGDFLGTGRIQDNKISLNYLTYTESKKWINDNISIKSQKEWILNVKENKIPIFIPNHPELYYYKKNRGWGGWKDFLFKNS